MLLILSREYTLPSSTLPTALRIEYLKSKYYRLIFDIKLSPISLMRSKIVVDCSVLLENVSYIFDLYDIVWFWWIFLALSVKSIFFLYMSFYCLKYLNLKKRRNRHTRFVVIVCCNLKVDDRPYSKLPIYIS